MRTYTARVRVARAQTQTKQTLKAQFNFICSKINAMKKRDGRKKKWGKISICLRIEGQRALAQGQPKWDCQRHTQMAFSVEEESRLATWWMAVCFRAKVNRTLCIENEAYQQSDLLGLMKIKNFLRPNSKLSFCLFLRLVSLAIKIIKENQTVAALKAAWMCTGRETFQRIMCMWNVNARYHFYQTLSAGWMVFNLFYFQCFLSFPATKSFKFGSELKT